MLSRGESEKMALQAQKVAVAIESVTVVICPLVTGRLLSENGESHQDPSIIPAYKLTDYEDTLYYHPHGTT